MFGAFPIDEGQGLFYNQSSILLDLVFIFEDIMAITVCRNEENIIVFIEFHFIVNFSK